MDSDTDTQVNDRDEKTVPLEALRALQGSVETLKVENAELRGKLDGFVQAKASEDKPVTEYSRAQLRGMVDKGQITQDEADSLWDVQTDRKTQKKIETAIQTSKKSSTVEAEIDQYIQRMPTLVQNGSKERGLVTQEFNRLVEAGLPRQSKATELAALKAVFGALEKEGRTVRETHQETGSDGGEADKTASTGGWPKDMPEKIRRHYDTLVQKGVYTKGHLTEKWSKYSKRPAA